MNELSREYPVGTTEEAAPEGIDFEELAKQMGFDFEAQDQTMSELESMFGDRIFHYGSYSGTVTELRDRCPAFDDTLQQGVEVAAAWLEANDEPAKDAVEDELIDESMSELDDESADDVHSKPVDQKIQPVEKKPVETKKTTSVKHQKHEHLEVELEVKSRGAPKSEKEVPEKILAIDTVVVQEIIQKDEASLTLPLDTPQQEVFTDTVHEAPVVAEKVVVEDEPNVEPVHQKDFVAPVLEELDVGPAPLEVEQDGTIQEITNDDEVEMPQVLPVIFAKKDMPQSEVVADTPEVQDEARPTFAEMVLDTEILEQEESEELGVEAPADPAVIELMAGFTSENPDTVVEFKMAELYHQACIVTEKIEALEHATTAQECRECLAELHAELAELLFQLGYTNATVIAERLMKQFDVATLKKYMVVLMRTVQSSRKPKPAVFQRSKAPAVYYRYGAPAVRMVVNT